MTERKLLDQLADKLRMKNYSRKTITAYVTWSRRFILFHGKRHPREMGKAEIEAYLSYLANKANVASSTQNQCFHALRFLYCEILGMSFENIQGLRSKEAKRLPTVLNREDTARVLNYVDGDPFHLMAQLLYGAGMRLSECQQLRIKDVDYGLGTIIIRAGKGDKDRTVPLPTTLVKPLMDQMNIARQYWNIDRQRGMPGVYVPNALNRKYPNIGCEWGWFWVFPAANYSIDPETKIRRRHHQYESGLQRAIRAATIKADITKRVSPHTFRHCYATHLLLAGYDIRTVAELMGHNDIKTTMIYLHILQPGGAGVESPLDKLDVAQWNIIRQ